MTPLRSPASNSFRLITALTGFLFFFSFQLLQAQGGVSVGFSKLEGYVVRPGMAPQSGLNTQLFSRKEQFDEQFMAQPAKGKKAGKLDFNRFVVLVCASAKTNTETNLSLQKIVKKNGVLEVYFLAIYGKKLAQPYTPACFYTTAIDRSLSGMVYYVNGKIVQDLRN